MKHSLKQIVIGIAIAIFCFEPATARADLFGGDVVVLTQILANAIMQLQQLQKLFNTGSDSLNLLRDINRGINDSLNLMRTVSPYTDPGLYSDWDRVQAARQRVNTIYGTVTPSRVATMQRDADQNVAEAITLNNQIYAYTNTIDQIGEAIKTYSHRASPGGAQKLTAESMGVMLNVMNQNLRAQATGLKLPCLSEKRA